MQIVQQVIQDASILIGATQAYLLPLPVPAAVLLTLHMEARLPDLKTDRLSADPDACIEFGENATEKVGAIDAQGGEVAILPTSDKRR